MPAPRLLWEEKTLSQLSWRDSITEWWIDDREYGDMFYNTACQGHHNTSTCLVVWEFLTWFRCCKKSSKYNRCYLRYRLCYVIRRSNPFYPPRPKANTAQLHFRPPPWPSWLSPSLAHISWPLSPIITKNRPSKCFFPNLWMVWKHPTIPWFPVTLPPTPEPSSGFAPADAPVPLPATGLPWARRSPLPWSSPVRQHDGEKWYAAPHEKSHKVKPPRDMYLRFWMKKKLLHMEFPNSQKKMLWQVFFWGGKVIFLIWYFRVSFFRSVFLFGTWAQDRWKIMKVWMVFL